MPRPLVVYWLAVAVIFVGTQPAIAASATKPGSACVKANAKASIGTKQLICRKVNGRLIWTVKSPTVAAKPAAPAPSATSTPQPKTPPEEVLYGQLLLEQLAGKAASAPAFTSYSVEVEPAIVGTMWERTQREGIVQSFAFLHALDLVPSKPVRIYIGWTDEWLVEKLTEVGGYCAPVGTLGGGGFCEGKWPAVFAHAGWFARNWGLKLNSTQFPTQFELGLVGNMPHELAHAGQISRGHEKYGNVSWALNPAWLREGWADLFKVLYFAKTRTISFADAHKIFVTGSNAECTKYSIRELSGSGSHPAQLSCEYTSGYLATLKLLSLVKDVDLQFRLPGTRAATQAEAFTKVFAVDYDDFIRQADEFIKRALNDRSWW